MTEILDGIIAIAWIWFYLIAALVCLTTALFVVAVLRYRPLHDRANPFDQVRQPDARAPKTDGGHGRSKLTADLL